MPRRGARRGCRDDRSGKVRDREEWRRGQQEARAMRQRVREEQRTHDDGDEDDEGAARPRKRQS